jgi:hypothetical protein
MLFADGLEVADGPEWAARLSYPHEWRHPRLGFAGAVSWVVCTADGTWEQFENVRKETRCLTDGPVN